MSNGHGAVVIDTGPYQPPSGAFSSGGSFTGATGGSGGVGGTGSGGFVVGVTAGTNASMTRQAINMNNAINGWRVRQGLRPLMGDSARGQITIYNGRILKVVRTIPMGRGQPSLPLHIDTGPAPDPRGSAASLPQPWIPDAVKQNQIIQLARDIKSWIDQNWGQKARDNPIREKLQVQARNLGLTAQFKRMEGDVRKEASTWALKMGIDPSKSPVVSNQAFNQIISRHYVNFSNFMREVKKDPSVTRADIPGVPTSYISQAAKTSAINMATTARNRAINDLEKQRITNILVRIRAVPVVPTYVPPPTGIPAIFRNAIERGAFVTRALNSLNTARTQAQRNAANAALTKIYNTPVKH